MLPQGMAFQVCFRLGKFENGRNRPVKITLGSADQVQFILRKYKTTNNVYINRDLTVKQQDLCYRIRKEFKGRLSKGESNIKLRYINGVPKIVIKEVKNN